MKPDPRPNDGPDRIGPRRIERKRNVPIPDLLPARMLNEFVYCPRLFFYEWVEGVFAHNVDTVEGAVRHSTVDGESQGVPPPDQDERFRARSVSMSSDRYGLTAKLDILEGADGVVVPVDYKKGRPRETEGGPEAWPPERIQIAVQALILRDNGYRCEEGVLYYDATRQRVRIPVDDELVAETLRQVAAAKELAASGRIPPPLVDSPKCPRCSLVGICLPDETRWGCASESKDGHEQLALFKETDAVSPVPELDEPRRLVPARDDLRPLYVSGHGITIGKEGEVLRIRDREKRKSEARIGEISQVNVFGNVQLTASAVQGLCRSDKPICHFSSGGWFYGITSGLGLRNAFLRRAQFRWAEDPVFCLSVARRFVSAKIRNQRTLLQRNHVEPSAFALRQLRILAERALGVGDLDELLGVEGTAARTYFQSFSGMLKVEDDELRRLDFDGRNRRPARDPVNSLLSFAYSLLAKELTIVCAAIGFDPFMGFFHQPRFGRPALALDLMEEFRPLVADSAVLRALNTGMITSSDFIRAGEAVAMKAPARKSFLRAYEQRMDELVTHPSFGYRVSYRRVLEIQARLLARVLEGELSSYPGFVTR